MPTYQPLAGKNGSISVGGTNLYLTEWSLATSCSLLELSIFSQAADGDGNFWKTRTSGMNDAQLMLRGRWDNANQPMAVGGAGTPGLRAGLSVTVTCTLASGVSFVVPGIVSRAVPGTRVEDAATFEATVDITGPPTFPSGTGTGSGSGPGSLPSFTF